MNIELHIERLLLDGLPMNAAAVRVLRATLETQLASLLTAAPPTLRHGYSVPVLRAAPIGPAHVAATTGRDIARSVHAALVPTGR